MLGRAALAMWWDVPSEARDELEHWHAFEHVPERLSIDGFLRASRWTDASGGEGFFVMYELSAYEVLASQGYLARLNAPTAWSTKMMPFHRNMVRAQCRVIHSHGAVTARHVLTLRFSPIGASGDGIMDRLEHLGKSYVQRPGVVGFHVLQHESPKIDITSEQLMRGNTDRIADRILIVSGYDLKALQALAKDELSERHIQSLRGTTQLGCQLYSLAYSAVPDDFC
jgi:hypothetical protein